MHESYMVWVVCGTSGQLTWSNSMGCWCLFFVIRYGILYAYLDTPLSVECVILVYGPKEFSICVYYIRPRIRGGILVLVFVITYGLIYLFAGMPLWVVKTTMMCVVGSPACYGVIRSR